MDESQSATAAFTQSFIASLHSVSPALAALHVARLSRSEPRVLPSPLSPVHCPRCCLPGVHTRIHRPAQSRKSASSRNTKSGSRKRTKSLSKHNQIPTEQRCSRIIRRTCDACGFVDAQAISTMRNPPQPSLEAARKTNDERTDKTRTTGPLPAIVIGNPHNANMKATPQANDNVPHIPATSMSSSSAAQAQSSKPQAGPDPMKNSSSLSRRQKKKPGLQEMLARSREQKLRKEDSSAGGLAAFLSGL